MVRSLLRDLRQGASLFARRVGFSGLLFGVRGRALYQSEDGGVSKMKIWMVKFGYNVSSVTDNWLVRGKDFAEASKKAIETAAKKGEMYTLEGEKYTSTERDVVSLELVGTEEF
jgi:hypothetical protein